MAMHDKDELWMSYLDGEMSASEAAAFAAGLSDAERARAEGEVRLEAALAARLGAGPACPEATWSAVLAQMDTRPRRSWWHVNRPLRLAAAIALTAG